MSRIERIYLSKSSMEIELNTYAVVYAHSIPINSNETILWKTSNTDIVWVDECTGQIRANGIGEAYITVYVENDPTVYAICHITVKGNIPVRSISFPVTEFTLLEGKTTTLGVVVEPSNATNQNISWCSCCPEIATVSSTGNVRAIKPGVVDIYATAENGSLTAKCTITVEKYIPVRSIRFPVSELTLKKGTTAKLNVVIEPSNATYSYVTWRSCCPEIATISSNGTVQAIKPGIVDIYATAENGSLTAKCTIRVVIDKVIIKEGESTAIITFESNNKKWKCVNADIVFNEENRKYGNYYLKLARDNIFVNPERDPETGLWDRTLKNYSDEEIKLIFAIDPHGLAYYVESYAAEKYSDLRERVEYKDRIFKFLFNRDPLYFRRENVQEWVQTTNKSNINEVLSESEIIFGMHKIHDDITEEQWKELGVKLAFLAAEILFTVATAHLIPPAYHLQAAIIYETVENVVKTYVLICTGIDTVDLIDSLGDALGGYTFSGTNLEWINDLTSAYGDLLSILDTQINSSPSYVKQIANHCIDEINYDINITLASGSTHNMREICNYLV